MAVRPTHVANENGESGESDDDPDRMDDIVDEMMADPSWVSDRLPLNRGR